MNNLKWLSNFELYLFILIFAVPCLLSSGLKPDPDFSRHHLFYPKVFHGRDNRQISSSKINQDELKHIEELVIYIDADDNKRYTLDLQLNRELITDSYFEKHQENGGYVINRPTIQDVELCHYNGKIREIPNSWAAISTCDGINGVVYDGESLHYIDSAGNGNVNGSFNGVHVLYSHNDLNKNFTCGFTDSNDVTESHHISHRRKRSTDMIHGPYNSNRKSRYIELVLVVDKMLYTNFNRDLRLIRKKCKEITNIINSLYMPLNIYVALVGVIIWTSDDEITLETSGDKTLTNFLHYRREVLVKDHPNDNAQLLTRTQFDGGVVGKALKGPICTYEYSGGVNMYHSDVIGLVATTIAHEMGHNLGMEHDTAECSCPSERCIMSPSASSATPSDWSSCSIELLALSFEHGMDYCLRNKPKRLFDSPVCGNSFVEPEEECDCGLPERCDNPCCNPITCRLHANATCATGECCDLKTCSIRKAGTECRSAIYECDLPEYCTGKSEYCPSDVFKIDGELCNSVKAYCYQGSCRTRNDQCQLLWGRSGESSADRCYELNTKGSRNGNCGYNRMKKNFTKCETEDVYCGLLQCKHYNEKLEYGMESVSTLSHSFMNSGGNVISCRTALVDLGLNEVDPGLSPDGSKCGENKMCVNQKCLPIEFVRKKLLPGACPHNCNGNGICNSKGHCHCKVGFAPPNCDTSGYGGSEDSGPASIPEEERSGLVKIIYFLLLALFPIAIVAGLHTYYTRRSPSYFWKKSRHSAHNEKIKQFQNNDTNKDVSFSGNHGKRSSSSLFVSNSTIQTLLPSKADDCKSAMVPSSNDRPSCTSADIKNNLIGNFNGIVITPLPTTSSTCSFSGSSTTSSSFGHNSPAAPSAIDAFSASSSTPPFKIPTVIGTGNATIKNSNNLIAGNSRPTRPAPRVPSSTLGASNTTGAATRPSISSPVLDNTTSSTVKQLIKSADVVAPSRPAPPVPAVGIADVKDVRATSALPGAAPSLVSQHNLKSSLPAMEKHPTSKDINSTLCRFASFMYKSHEPKVATGDDGSKRESALSSTLKANKIDKDILRNLEISDPIPINDLNIPPSNPLPLGKDEERAVVMRAHSLRQTGKVNVGNGRRPTIPTFCSVRYPPSKRPTSIPNFSRPTSPPPRPPILPPSNTYESLNVRQTATDDEADDDNIYAVIEEGPLPSPGSPAALLAGNKANRFNIPNSDSLTDETKQSNVASADDTNVLLTTKQSAADSNTAGLLSEIVSEIQARNNGSIYYSEADDRKHAAGRDQDEDNISAITDISSISTTAPNPLYENASSCYGDRPSSPAKSVASSTTSSGYQRPISSKSRSETTENKHDSSESNNNAVNGAGVLKVPDRAAPSYKVFNSSLRRNFGPVVPSLHQTAQFKGGGGSSNGGKTNGTSGSAAAANPNARSSQLNSSSSFKPKPFVPGSSVKDSSKAKTATVSRTGSPATKIPNTGATASVTKPANVVNTSTLHGSGFAKKYPVPAQKPTIVDKEQAAAIRPLKKPPSDVQKPQTEQQPTAVKANAANKKSSTVASLQQKFEGNRITTGKANSAAPMNSSRLK